MTTTNYILNGPATQILTAPTGKGEGEPAFQYLAAEDRRDFRAIVRYRLEKEVNFQRKCRRK